MGTRLFGYESNYYPGHTRDINVSYISGTVASGSGIYGIVTSDYRSTRSYTPIVGGSTISQSSNAMYAAPYLSKTFYISAGGFTTEVPGSGVSITFEGSHTKDGYWYPIWQTELKHNEYYYSTTTEHHPYIRVRISGLSSGATGSWMVNAEFQS